MDRFLVYSLFGYLSGSVLYAYVWGRILGRGDVTQKSKDQNPGTANAFVNGGFLCGVLTLFCDLGKGFLPVFLFLQPAHELMMDWRFAIVLAAPVIGHVFSLYHHFHGGKGIAVTFGCLLGMYPYMNAAYLMAICFLFFSLIVKISPDFYRTLAAYAAAWIGMIFFLPPGHGPVAVGFCLIAASVFYRMHHSLEKREKLTVKIAKIKRSQ